VVRAHALGTGRSRGLEQPLTEYRLGINTCFAVKRWPEPDEWGRIVSDDLGLDLVQHSLDLVDLDAGAPVREQAEAVADACAARGIEVGSTFTGLGAYGRNLLLDPDPGARARAAAWFRRAIDFTAAAGGRAAGGHVGAYSVADWRDENRRGALWDGLRSDLGELAAYAARHGLEAFLFENMAARREPSTIAEARQLLAPSAPGRAAVALCLDVGHQCVVGTSGDDRDPYAWLEQLGAFAPVIHLQQSDAEADHHWPFTAARNAAGRIEADSVLAALDASGAEEVELVLEVIPSFEQDDDLVLAELVESAAHWRAALGRHG
jgi:D-erythrulose 1-phosphate 3-epimerase